jgi:putative flippase GtrA
VRTIKREIVLYLISGAVATITFILLSYLVLYFLFQDIFIANLIAFCCTFFLSYFLQSTYVFQKKKNTYNLGKFFVIQLIALILAITTTEYLASYNEYVKILIIAIIFPFFTFLIHKFWTFKEKIG